MTQWRLTILLMLFVLASCTETSDVPADPRSTASEPVFVGSEVCRSCHESEYADWQGSHHQLAMQDATVDTILADFDDATVEYFGATTRMHREGDRFVMQTDNKDGEIQEFEVSHVFGITPLQQYLTEFPDGRKQVLPFAWDARSTDEGGQRWYHLYPDEQILHDDVLHWTGRYFNWNGACAECHSTDLKVNYNLKTDTFETTWSEISVGCEACHGPGSVHIEQSAGNFDALYGFSVDLDDRDGAAWVMNTETGFAERSVPVTSHQQPESCGRCHARRAVIAETYEYGKPLLDTHRVSLLEEPLYHPDGRILEEVYVYGSFVQSKMYAAGVTCSDCHNPHSGELVTGPNPNDVCSQCHLPTKFAITSHAANNNCVNCHMQDETYMGVDPRRDHSFRLPDTATDPRHYGKAIVDARAGLQSLEAISNLDYPVIARATLLVELQAPFVGDAELALNAAIDSDEAMLRLAAVTAIQRAAPEHRLASGAKLLADPVLAVRIQAAATYVDHRDLLPVAEARLYESAAQEYRESLLASAFMPESLTVLSEFEHRSGNASEAEDYLRSAIKLDPRFALARHSYGLALVRAGDYDGAMEQLRAAHTLEPTSARFAYVYAVSLNSAGLREEAVEVLRTGLGHNPDDADMQAFLNMLTN